MAIGLLGVVDRANVVDAPEVAAIDGIAMARPGEFHALIDHPVCPRQTHQMRHRIAMHHARGLVQVADLAARARRWKRLPPVVERIEPTGGIDRSGLKESEQPAGLLQQPGAVHRAQDEIGMRWWGCSALMGAVGHDGSPLAVHSRETGLSDAKRKSKRPPSATSTGPASSSRAFRRKSCARKIDEAVNMVKADGTHGDEADDEDEAHEGQETASPSSAHRDKKQTTRNHHPDDKPCDDRNLEDATVGIPSLKLGGAAGDRGHVGLQVKLLVERQPDHHGRDHAPE